MGQQGIVRRIAVVVLCCVLVEHEANLVQVGRAGDHAGAVAGGGENGQQDRSKSGQDDEKLDQGKPVTAPSKQSPYPRSSFRFRSRKRCCSKM